MARFSKTKQKKKKNSQRPPFRLYPHLFSSPSSLTRKMMASAVRRAQELHRRQLAVSLGPASRREVLRQVQNAAIHARLERVAEDGQYVPATGALPSGARDSDVGDDDDSDDSDGDGDGDGDGDDEGKGRGKGKGKGKGRDKGRKGRNQPEPEGTEGPATRGEWGVFVPDVGSLVPGASLEVRKQFRAAVESLAATRERRVLAEARAEHIESLVALTERIDPATLADDLPTAGGPLAKELGRCNDAVTALLARARSDPTWTARVRKRVRETRVSALGSELGAGAASVVGSAADGDAPDGTEDAKSLHERLVDHFRKRQRLLDDDAK
jgi:hypothetical protein